MFAVWNGQPGKGAGGTADAVFYARSQGKTIVWIHSETGEVTREHWEKERFRDPFFELFRHFPEPTLAEEPATAFERCFRQVDQEANRGVTTMRKQEMWIGRASRTSAPI